MSEMEDHMAEKFQWSVGCPHCGQTKTFDIAPGADYRCACQKIPGDSLSYYLICHKDPNHSKFTRSHTCDECKDDDEIKIKMSVSDIHEKGLQSFYKRQEGTDKLTEYENKKLMERLHRLKEIEDASLATPSLLQQLIAQNKEIIKILGANKNG
ncbi:MAG: hypothetical protein WEC35_03300 [Nitrosopumilaceae archaeon]